MHSPPYEPTPDRADLPHAYLILIRFHVVLLAVVLWALGTSTPASWPGSRAPLERPAVAQVAHP